MATINPFALLGEDDSDDPSLLIAIQQQRVAAKKPEPVAPAASIGKLPTKPLAPAQAGINYFMRKNSNFCWVSFRKLVFEGSSRVLLFNAENMNVEDLL